MACNQVGMASADHDIKLCQHKYVEYVLLCPFVPCVIVVLMHVVYCSEKMEFRLYVALWTAPEFTRIELLINLRFS